MNIDLKINNKVIETERLILREFIQNDLSDFNEYASVPGVGEMAGWHHHKSIEETQEILNWFIKDGQTFAIVYKENNKVIGSIGIDQNKINETFKTLENYAGCTIGFVLSKDYWGKGIMPEAVKGVINYLFNDLNLDYIICGYYTFNNQSKRVQEKCGFKPFITKESTTRMGTKELAVYNLLVNPDKNIKLINS